MFFSEITERSLYEYNQKTLSMINELRLETISGKAIREGYKSEAIADKLMQDRYLIEIKKEKGENQALKIALKAIDKAMSKRGNTSSRKMIEAY